ncbi:hypothetical protein A3L12_07485 [Thermococcus sp. P6]|uniref:hypothetical protein n=1 Tax=Thermococcus sp. P6 TaxID=122420 RepID=UPI000B59F226|nr:hypothetical protein [Thermococcus sp. P6]ASJ11148.1 hypothetical protein A3L12_07485 [Thermococcus sp. P6]
MIRLKLPGVLLLSLFLLGIASSMGFTSTKTTDSLPANPANDDFNVLTKKLLSGEPVYFYGRDAPKNAQRLIDALHEELGVVIDFNKASTSDIRFIGVVIKPTGGNRYYTAYYIVEGPVDLQKEVMNLQKLSEDVKKLELSYVTSQVFPPGLEISDNWKRVGSISWKRSALVYLGQYAYMEFKADYAYITTTSGQYWYLVQTTHRGRPTTSTIAVKDLETIVDANHPQNTWQQIEDWCPKNNGGPTTIHSHTFAVDNANECSSTPTVSYEASEGYYMKWYDYTGGYESKLDVVHELYKKRIGPDIAWGARFTVEPSAIFSADPSKGGGGKYYLSLDHVAKGTFYVKSPTLAIFPMSPSPIQFHVTVYPWTIANS